MSDFEVPLNPGWYAALEEKHGDIVDAAAAVSPAVIHRYEHLTMSADVPCPPPGSARSCGDRASDVGA